MKKFKENVIELLNDKGINIQDFCKSLSIGKNRIYDLDKHLPSVNTAVKIANALNLSIDYLLGNIDLPENDNKFLNVDKFATNLESILKQQDKSKLKFCKDLKFSTDCFTRWRKGALPYLSTLIEIANYLNCNIDDLLETER